MKKIYLSIACTIFILSKIFGQCATPSLVPYYNGFQGITNNNQLPPCWAVSNGAACLTFTATGASGNRAAFSYISAGDNYFFTNAFQLNTGITYSISSFYRESGSGSNSWTNFSFLLGTSQSTTGMVTVASTNGPFVSNGNYTALSNTFVVSTTGIYYVAIKSSAASGPASFLIWDDFAITIPCTPIYNFSNISIAASSSITCSGNSLTISATGVNTYTWANGAVSNTFTNVPTSTTNYMVIGTNTLTGCTNTAAVTVTVHPSPFVAFVATSDGDCAGSTVNLGVIGSSNVLWSTGQTGSLIAVQPLVNTVYTATVTNIYNCSTSGSIEFSVTPLPVITVANSGTAICPGQPISLLASGAISYTWNSLSGLMAGNPVVILPTTASTAVNIKGKDANGCVGELTYFLNINACTALNDLSDPTNRFRVHPNPGNNEFILETTDTSGSTILITDVAGRTVFSSSIDELQTVIDLSGSPAGIYLVKISSAHSTDHLKLIKQN